VSLCNPISTPIRRPIPSPQAPYLASLGVNAVELLPVFEWDELEFRWVHWVNTSL
jgi:pullulanase/glycogen debranching enzyme